MTQEYEELIETGQFESALKKIFERIENDTDNEVHYINGGLVLYKLDKKDEAVKFLERAIELNSESSVAIYTLGSFYYEAGQYSDARTLFLSIYDKMSEDKDLNYMIAMCYVNLNEPKMAIPFFEVAIKDSPDTEILFQYGVLLCQIGLIDQGETLLEKVASMDAHADAEYNLGLVQLVKYKNLKLARTHFERAIEIQHDHILAHNALKEIEKEADNNG